MIATNCQIDKQQAIAHLEALGYQRGDRVSLRYIHPTSKISVKAPKLNFSECEQYQSQGYDAYLVINSGGDCDADITEGRAIFYEHDDLDKETQLYLWQTLGLPEPTIQVDTGGKSVHSYWVLSEPIPVEQWRELQVDLLEFSKGDRTLKNPSRVLRLAGTRYMKGKAPGSTLAVIVSQSSKKYQYQELREVIPMQQVHQTAMPMYQPSIGDDVPLYQCVRREDRDLINNGAPTYRNESGMKLARNLIGTALRLNNLGVRFTGDPRQLFEDYCHRCPSGGGWNQREWDKIWESAVKYNPTAALTDDAILNCVKAWQHNQQVVRRQQPAPTSQHRSDCLTDNIQHPQKKLPLEDAAKLAKDILKSDSDELTANLKLEEVRQSCGMNSWDWERKIIKPLKRNLEGDRFKLELLGLLQIDDPVERIRQQALLAPKYQMSTATLDKALGLIKQRTSTPEVTALDLGSFFDLESEGLEWLIPELLPVGETVLCVATPKCGKTLLGIDAAYAVATGEDTFLGQSVPTGRVLLVSVDESANSTKSKLIKRGFRRQDAENVRVMSRFDVSQMAKLEAELEDFRPNLVIIDSLKRITHGREISENSAEFAEIIYELKELLTRYKASGILVHHANKDREAMGVGRVRGSTAIAGAVWGTWQLDHIPKEDPGNKKKFVIDPKDPKRLLTVFARDTEGQQMRIELNPENNRWEKLGEVGEAEEGEGDREALKSRILAILHRNAHTCGLSGREIIELLGMTPEDGRGIYTVLNRMVNRRLIDCRPAPGDKRYNVYSLPKLSQDTVPNNTQQSTQPPPSPTPTVPEVEYVAVSIVDKGFEDTQQITQHPSKITQHPEIEKPYVEYSNALSTGVSEILNTPDENMGGGCSEIAEKTEKSSQLSHQPDAIASSIDTQEAEIEVTGFSLYDNVRVKDPYHVASKYHGCVENFRQGFESVEIQVRWEERFGKPGSQTEWYRLDELCLRNLEDDLGE
ncbi:AAA family ATPase [Trichocoleus sp. Lan]|uniref:AAA family ATPase n=1 Tax=Trichocoleus sp. Lan TaxID=2933927 RepID=UPI0032975FDD